MSSQLGPFELNNIYCGECVDLMAQMPNDCIDLTITSPPYDKLRRYKGYTFDFESIARQLYRVTKKGGVVVWVVGDETVKGCESLTSFKQVLDFKNIGFAVETMIYQKSGTPAGVNKVPRYAQCFEYMFVLVKGLKPKTFNPLMQKNKNAGKKVSVRPRTQRSGELKTYGKNASKKIHEYSRKRNIWKYHAGAFSGDDQIKYNHPATFPNQLAHDHIVSWSNAGDLVFDPMIGSGTTAKMARQLDRNYLGFDISEEYVKLAKERLLQYS